MSYKWFKHWQNEAPNAVILIETQDGYLSYEESAIAVYRLTTQPFFTPHRRERAKGQAISVPRREFPCLLDRLMRGQISYLVAREDYLVYQKNYDDRFYLAYAAPIDEEDAEASRYDRPISIDDRITVKNLETRKECVWKLVPTEEADVTKREKSGLLDMNSSVAKAIIGHFVGEDVDVTFDEGDVVTYRLQLAIDLNGHKLKKHHRPVVEAEEEPEEEPTTTADTEEAAVPESDKDDAEIAEVPTEDEIGETDEAEAVAEEAPEEVPTIPEPAESDAPEKPCFFRRLFGGKKEK